jgi:hypothetical protein
MIAPGDDSPLDGDDILSIVKLILFHSPFTIQQPWRSATYCGDECQLSSELDSAKKGVNR